MNDPTRLFEAAWGKYSQYGEDGIIDHLLGRLPNRDSWCVEFGAWDGLHLTNTRRLIEELGYSAVLIEGDQQRYEFLRKNNEGFPNVLAIHRFVRTEGRDSLDSILSETRIPEGFDLLSIDIDGDDYHVWESLRGYSPKIVVIEFNPTMANELEYVQPRNTSVMHGSSARSLVLLGKTKGYGLVAVTVCNAFFVRLDLLGAMGIQERQLSEIRNESETVTHLSFGYDGTVILSGVSRLPWHGIRLNSAQMQPLPMWLRKFPDNYNLAQYVAYRLVKLVSQPDEAVLSLKTRLVGKLRRK
jgi:hypothetical protein